MFDNLCIVDVECNIPTLSNFLKYNEILEFPMIILNQKTNKEVGQWHSYVRPTIDQKVSGECTAMTGIDSVTAFIKNDTNGTINKDLWQTLDSVNDYLNETKVLDKSFVFLSYTNFDGRQINREAHKKRIPIKPYMHKWIDLKRVFPPEQLL